MKDWCNWLSFDMMGDLTFGKSFGCVEESRHRFVPEVVLDSTKFIYVVCTPTLASTKHSGGDDI